MLQEIISQNQSVFVLGRMTFDNVMVAYKTIHIMKEKHSGKYENMGLKLDMSKVYDSVEWLL